jgi:hypothetical protein
MMLLHLKNMDRPSIARDTEILIIIQEEDTMWSVEVRALDGWE